MNPEYLIIALVAIPMKPALIAGVVRTIGPGLVEDARTSCGHHPENKRFRRLIHSHQRGIDIFQEH